MKPSLDSRPHLLSDNLLDLSPARPTPVGVSRAQSIAYEDLVSGTYEGGKHGAVKADIISANAALGQLNSLSSATNDNATSSSVFVRLN